MNRLIICYIRNGKLRFDANTDFKEIMFRFGETDEITKLDERMCRSKKEVLNFERVCKAKYLVNHIVR